VRRLFMGTRFQHVDAFADRPFVGNPAGGCLFPEEASAEWMQRAAAEVDLSETAFVRRRSDGAFDLRWFPPTTEVERCGHATLATAHTLWELGELAPTEAARFHTRSGLLTASRHADWIELDFPASPTAPAAGIDEDPVTGSAHCTLAPPGVEP
jgi:PhzF family phenazine biosynthesis protein